MTLSALLYFLLLNVCHWAGDYTHLSTDLMLQAKSKGSPIEPIIAHAVLHALLFFLLLNFFVPFEIAGLCFFLQLFTHFGIDLLKGKLNVWYPSLSSPANRYHWWVFGADQFLHQVVIIVTVYIISNILPQ